MARRRKLYTNARLLDPATGLDAKGALLTEGDRILDLGPKLGGGSFAGDIEVIDCQGHCLCPGLIDMHVWLREPGAEHQETMATAARAAAAGGVTSMVAMPNTEPVIDEVALVEFTARRAVDSAVVRILPAAAITKGTRGEELCELGLLAEAGAVAFTDGDRPVANARLMRRALSYATSFDLLLMQHCEEPSLAKGGVMNEGEIAARLGLAGIPAIAETIMLERDIRLLEVTGSKLHASHLSTRESFEAVRRAKQRGLRLTAGAAPHNFALNELDVGDYRTFAKVKPPLRIEDDRRAVVEAIADGTVDIISSAHSPQDPENKRLPFAQAEFGIIGLETLLPLTLELYHNGSVPLLKLLACLTCNPARLLKLESGRLAPGAPADLLLFDPDSPWRVDEKKFRSKAKNSPYDGRRVQGHALRTIVGGETVFQRKREA
ncbi:MAG TPA: dihydroorotase [Ferrovibrio sp.]|jgi:dihydroorotase|uniref:dihydroorotase n=1 Tax=Ferrovibrio sp. TaxID=1917215 RepID=UPI002B4B7322|nr:dihydroorotase [Ferrovibrio sp.]HLT77220.1 dihydroorotase [Ferrovibrio sp.]